MASGWSVVAATGFRLSAVGLVQEYGRYFNMPTVCFRGGCLTGPNHPSAELHGFLAYLVRALKEGRTYRIYGYKGKQVRDNIHAYDVCMAFEAFYERLQTDYPGWCLSRSLDDILRELVGPARAPVGVTWRDRGAA